MAPEIIKYHGAKPVSDVWSVGCSIIEFIQVFDPKSFNWQGEPPYYQLDTYAAMYKMVEDEHPPIPGPISLVSTDLCSGALTLTSNI